MTVAGDIVANLTVNSKGWSSGLKDASSAVNSFSGFVTAAGAIVAGAFGFSELISSASNMQETMNKFDVVFGDNAEVVEAWADDFALNIGRSERQIAEFMGSSQDLFVPIGFDSGAATELSKTITALSIDLASFNNLTDEQTFGDLQAALTGSGEVMKKYGVIVSEAAVKQELLNQSINPAAATEVEKVQARLNIILAGTTAAQGDAMRSSEGWANVSKKVEATIENLAGTLGEKLLPVVTQTASDFNDLVIASAPLIGGFFDLIAGGLDIASDWSPIFIGAATAIVVVVAATKAFTLVTMAAAAAQRIMLALSGPNGWFILAGAVGAAATSAYLMKSQTDEVNKALGATETAQNKAVQATARHVTVSDDLVKALKAADSVQMKLNRQLMTPAQQAIADAQQLADDWWKASRAGSQLGMRFEDLKRLQAKTLEEKSGFSGMFTDITDELRVLRGEITETELKFEQMSEFGVSDKQIQKLREANAERDRLLGEQQQKKEAESAAEARISGIQKTVRDSFGTPLDEFLEKTKAVTEAINAGALTKAEGNAYLEAERKKMLEEADSQIETPEQRKAALTEAISVNSEGANRMLVDLMNRKGGQSIDEQRLAIEKRNQKLHEQSLAAMEAVKENTSKPQLATKPFRPGA